MRFGYFDDENREYVITTPDTPYPWINYLGTEDFFSLISHRAGGYCFYRDARLRRLLRYRYNNVPTDVGGRYFYVNDGGDVWSPSHAPVGAPLDSYECRHGLGYTRISGERRGLRAELLFLVPPGHTAEVHQLKLRNTASWPRTVKVFSFVEWCLWNAHDDMTNYQRNFSTGEVEIERDAAGCTLYHTTEYRERRDHFAFYHVNAEVSGFDTDRETFMGLYGDFARPRVVAAGASGNSVASGWSPVASHGLEVTLAPGEEKTFVFTLGYVENRRDAKWQASSESSESPERRVVNKERAHALIGQLSRPEQIDAAMRALAERWTRLLGTFSVTSPDERLNRMVNIWNPYQCMVTFNMSRSASYFETGIGRGMGFRDSNQDLLGFVHLVPERARERILDIAATQKADGSAYHQYQPLTKRGNNDVGGGFNDDPLWLVSGVAAYVRETGDWSILDESVPFDNATDSARPLFEHCQRAFQHVLENLGPHGLPLIGRADWNDCLNLNCFSETPDESFQTTGNRQGRTAESVFIAGLFVAVAPDFARLAEHAGQTEVARRARAAGKRMAEVILEHGWDGGWFLRAYDFFGNKVGSRENDEAKIFIEPQGFCVMAGVGVAGGQARQALDAVKERLDTRYGIVLNSPSYTRYHVELGEISSYPPGYKENGGIFCHNNPWIMIAETVLGRGDRAFAYWKKIAPAYLEDESEVHRLEPYVYAQMIAGKDAVRHGEAKNSWLTGTAAWNFVAISQHLLGVRPDWDGLRVHPCIGGEIGRYTVTRRCRGAEYRIQVENSGEGRAPRLTVDGKPIDGDLVPYAPAGATVVVECEV